MSYGQGKALKRQALQVRSPVVTAIFHIVTAFLSRVILLQTTRVVLSLGELKLYLI